MKEDLYNQGLAVLTDYLRMHRLRNTVERKMLLRQICSYKGAFTAEQLLADIAQVGYVSVATVYNTLDLLEDACILTKLSAHRGCNKAEYELVLRKTNVLHWVCTTCGKKVEFKDKAIEDLLRGKHFSSFMMDHFSLCAYGTCLSCRRKQLKKGQK